MNTQPTWFVPSDAAAEREVSRLTISQILDRQMELEKVIALDDSQEAARARVMLRATYTVLSNRYVKK
jgi:hypothetical protein